MSVTRKKGILVYLEKDQKRTLDMIASACDISGSEIIRQALTAYTALLLKFWKENSQEYVFVEDEKTGEIRKVPRGDFSFVKDLKK